MNRRAVLTITSSRALHTGGIRGFGLGVYLLFGILLTVLPLDTFFALGSPVVVWITAVVLLSLVFRGYRMMRLREDNALIAAPTLLMAFYFFRYGWGALVAYYWGYLPFAAYPYFREMFYAGGVWYDLPRACHLVLIGAMGLFLGAAFPGRRVAAALPSVTWNVSATRLKRSVAVYMLIGPLLYWILAPLVPMSYAAVAFTFFSITDTMFLIAGCYAFSSAPASRMAWVLLIVVAYIVALPTLSHSGQMVPLLMPGLMIGCGYVVARRSVPWVAAILALPVLLLVVLPITAFFKLSASQDKAAEAFEQFAISGYRARVELALERSVARFSGITFPAVFSKFYPSAYPYALGETFIIEASGLVPRAIWPDKPEVSPALNRFSEDVGMVARGGPTSMVFDAISEYYLNFGRLGVLLLSMLHGWYIATAHEWLVRRGNGLIGVAIYIVIIAGNWDFFGLVNALAYQVKNVVIWLLIYRLMTGLGRAGRRRVASAPVPSVTRSIGRGRDARSSPDGWCLGDGSGRAGFHA